VKATLCDKCRIQIPSEVGHKRITISSIFLSARRKYIIDTELDLCITCVAEYLIMLEKWKDT
jgi:hypothetical protein